METIKLIFWVYKAKTYDSLIKSMTKAREELKAKQAKYTERSEYYTDKVKRGGKL